MASHRAPDVLRRMHSGSGAREATDALRELALQSLRASSTPETAVARPAIERLVADGWKVYQEVEVHQGGARADIVALRGPEVLICEAKRALSLDLIAQAAAWRHYANRVIAVVPSAAGDDDGRRLARQVLRWKGVGLWEVDAEVHYDYEARWLVGPTLTVRESVEPSVGDAGMAVKVRAAIRPEHATYAEAGNAEGKRWTPWRATCDAVRAYVEQHPEGVLMRELLDAVPTHYSSRGSAASGLRHWIAAGRVTGVRIEAGKLLPAPTVQADADIPPPLEEP